jgi:putative CRISPR-associated protein (TIGR02619 family)
MRTVLTTVGTSLVTNARKALGLNMEEAITEAQVANYLRRADPEKASAETNSLSRLLHEDDEIVFLCSQTEEGKKCAEALRRFYDSRGHRAQVREVRDLNYTERRFKMRGLRSLVATLVGLIREERKRGRKVLVNATGGFKAEIAYATLVGLLFDVPVYYIHEAFREIIEMPPTPISWDYSLLADHEEFFEWLFDQERPTREVDARLRDCPRELRLLLSEVEGSTMLSPAGEAFYEAYLDRLQTAQSVPILLSSSAQKAYEAAEPSVREVFDRALRKLRLRDLRVAGSERLSQSDCLVYPKGHRDERLFYFEGKGGRIYVCELARHSDKTYERLRERTPRFADYRDFQPWQARS